MLTPAVFMHQHINAALRVDHVIYRSPADSTQWVGRVWWRIVGQLTDQQTKSAGYGSGGISVEQTLITESLANLSTSGSGLSLSGSTSISLWWPSNWVIKGLGGAISAVGHSRSSRPAASCCCWAWGGCPGTACSAEQPWTALGKTAAGFSATSPSNTFTASAEAVRAALRRSRRRCLDGLFLEGDWNFWCCWGGSWRCTWRLSHTCPAWHSRRRQASCPASLRVSHCQCTASIAVGMAAIVSDFSVWNNFW